MKKITFLLAMILSSFWANAQTCVQEFIMEGEDVNSVLTINSSELNCYSGTLNSIKISDALLGSDFYCGEWYTFDIDIDGVVTTDVCYGDLIDMDVTGFTTITITSYDNDDWTDDIAIGIALEVNFTATTVPNCDAELTTPAADAEANLTGNLVWTPATGGAASYLLQVGTTSGASNIVNVELEGNVTSYDIPGILEEQTQYFVNIIPSNTIGSATGCVEYSFTTGTATPGDFCSNAIDLTNETSPLSSTTVGALNDNLIVCGANGQVANTYGDLYYSVLVPNGSMLTIGQTVNGYDSANVIFYGDCDNRTNIDCFDDDDDKVIEWVNETGADQTVYWVQDGWSGTGTFTLAWSVFACTPAEASYTVVSDCENGEQFMVDVNVTTLGSAPSVSVSDNQGSAVQVLTAEGIATFGPYPNNTPVIFTVVNDQDDNCTLTSPAMNQLVCPPANDNCSGAIELALNTAYTCDTVLSATLNGATGSVVTGNTCSGNANDDIWYSFVATATSHRVSLLDVTPYVDLYHSLWTGDCEGGLTLVPNSCSDGNISNPSGLVVDQVYYLRIYSYGAANSTSTFNICIGTPPPPPANDTCETAIDLTNEISPIQSSTEGATNTNLNVCNNDGEEVENIHPDVYYSIVVPNGSTLSIGQTTNNYDSANVVFYGDCDNRTIIDCYDDSDEKIVEWANNTGEEQTVYWVQDGWSGAGTFTLAWSVIACTPAEATYTVVSDCENGEQFMVEVDVTSLGSATSVSVSDNQGTAVQVLTEAGIATFGPYANGEAVIFTVVNDQDENCTLTSPEMNQVACPPANDLCINAEELTVGAVFAENEIEGTNLGATKDSTDPIPSCEAYEFANNGKDVWFSFIVPASGTITVETKTNTGTTLTDTGLAVYSGECGSIVSLGCNTDDGDGNFSKLSLSGLTAGEELLVRVWGYNGASGSFKISAYDASLSSSQFDIANFKLYPNPVKDILNLSYTQNISNVEVFNMLGQQVLTKSVDATQGQVDMSNLAAGTYLVKVATDNQVKTIKVVKQ
ncbi:T9SS type A sorting domain-containing protein [Flavobacterium sp. PLA-1-15]|uniref:T9SS type A sorting domain-containing protein n=1 Tax=Flavobacterium sp. PLA-1-15 TaxID=3380533 RepID=UPI003B773EF4